MIFFLLKILPQRSIKGISAKFWYDFIGKVSTKNFEIDDPIFKKNKIVFFSSGRSDYDLIKNLVNLFSKDIISLLTY